jgi:hypothetical protein
VNTNTYIVQKQELRVCVCGGGGGCKGRGGGAQRGGGTGCSRCKQKYCTATLRPVEVHHVECVMHWRGCQLQALKREGGEGGGEVQQDGSLLMPMQFNPNP